MSLKILKFALPAQNIFTVCFYLIIVSLNQLYFFLFFLKYLLYKLFLARSKYFDTIIPMMQIAVILDPNYFHFINQVTVLYWFFIAVIFFDFSFFLQKWLPSLIWLNEYLLKINLLTISIQTVYRLEYTSNHDSQELFLLLVWTSLQLFFFRFKLLCIFLKTLKIIHLWKDPSSSIFFLNHSIKILWELSYLV